jgi:Translationally controlled tumour protein
MIVYRDIISEDEVLSDAFKLSPVVDKDGAVVRRAALIFQIDDILAFSNFLLAYYDKVVYRI